MAVIEDERMQDARDQDVPMECSKETQDAKGEGTVPWKPGDRVYAVWAGNGSYYAATVAAVQAQSLLVTWDDADMSHRSVPFEKVKEPSDESTGWSMTKIDVRATIRDTAEKGRCLFVNEACDPGEVVFVEKPLQLTLPSLSQKLWEHLKKLHEAQPLNLGTVTFHFAALMSQLQLDPMSIDIILDKFVPDANEEPGEDVKRILQSIQENMQDFTDIVPAAQPIDPRRLQRLVSAWRYNSFGHHKEDGLVLYNRISMCSHSCDPTCCWSYGDDDAFVLRARVALKKGDELTISYLQDEDLLKSTKVRQQKLQNWRFTCMCQRCCLHVDTGRGFRCRRCRVGIIYANAGGGLEPCRMCNASATQDDSSSLIRLEEEYVQRVESLDKTDISDVETVYEAAMDIFERHWMLYVMDTMLWEAYKEKKLPDAIEHLRRRIDFHENYYRRPTFILAWCHEELGDCIQKLFPDRKWQFVQQYQRAYQMLAILCGTNHQYTASPYNKLWQASGAAST